MSHFFISYSHDDTDYAHQLAAALRQRQFAVWIDEDIEYGERWFARIVTAIRGSAGVIVIMTPQAEQSEWVEKEILLAKRENKPILPLLLKGREFALLITDQYEDVRGAKLPPEAFFDTLKRLVTTPAAVVMDTPQWLAEFFDTYTPPGPPPVVQKTADEARALVREAVKQAITGKRMEVARGSAGLTLAGNDGSLTGELLVMSFDGFQPVAGAEMDERYARLDALGWRQKLEMRLPGVRNYSKRWFLAGKGALRAKYADRLRLPGVEDVTTDLLETLAVVSPGDKPVVVKESPRAGE